jgi:hypothetical protein
MISGLVAVLMLVTAGCRSTCDISIPTSVHTDRSFAASLKASLETANASGEFSTNWKSVVDKTFAQPGQDDVKYLMLLKARMCEKDPAARQQMLDIVDRAFSQKYPDPTGRRGIGGRPHGLSARAEAKIDTSPLKSEIQQLRAE